MSDTDIDVSHFDSHPIRDQITHHCNQMPCRHHSVLWMHLVMWSRQQVECSLSTRLLTKPRLQEGGRHHFGHPGCVLVVVVMKVMEVEAVGVGLWKFVHMMLWVQVMLGLQRWSKTTGATRRKETKLTITRGRFWGEKMKLSEMKMEEKVFVFFNPPNYSQTRKPSIRLARPG